MTKITDTLNGNVRRFMAIRAELLLEWEIAQAKLYRKWEHM